MLRTSTVPNEAEMRLRQRLSKLGAMKLLRGTKVTGELERLQDQLDRLQEEPSAEEIWNSVELARNQDRPYTLDYVERIFDDFFELHGDRGRADDRAIVAGLGSLEGRTVVLARAPEGPRPQGAHEPKLRDGISRGVPEGDAGDGARRPPRLPAGHAGRHSRRVPGRGRRAARAGGRDRSLAGGDGAAVGAHGVLRHRRRRLGRRGRDRRGRPRPHAGARDLLRDLARRLRRDPLA